MYPFHIRGGVFENRTKSFFGESFHRGGGTQHDYILRVRVGAAYMGGFLPPKVSLSRGPFSAAFL